MKFGRPLAIIFHYTVQFKLVCCKSSVPDMGPNTILKIKKKIKRRLKREITKNSNIQYFGRPLAIIFHYNLKCCKGSVSDMGPNTILKIKKYIYQKTS